MIDSPDVRASNQRFIRRAMNTPLLSRERETDLAWRWVKAQDQQALHELVQAHTRLVVSIATQYRGYGLSLSDLLQEGSLGLMQAASRFDPEREVRFSTYAVWWIRAAIQDFILRNWSMVRIGTTTSEKSLFFNLRRLRAKIASVGDVYMSSDAKDEIAEQLKVNVKNVERMEGRLSGPDQSVNAPVGEDGESEWQDLMVDDGPSPEEIVSENRDLATRRRWLQEAVGRLAEREQRIIRERHLAEEQKTLAELGEEFGISKERVRQIEHRALEQLRRAMQELSRPRLQDA
ncbi:MAG: RNA polymerase factor sigma-32 [Rhodovibrionaceae bacterium]|nr:RNA polymerase factor sigma-32 [Rhodovibrionaceae bacterium]